MSRPVTDDEWGMERHHWDHMTCAGLCWGCGKPSRSHKDPAEIQKCLDNWGDLSAWPDETLRLQHFSSLGRDDISNIRQMSHDGVFNNKPCRSCKRPMKMVYDWVYREVVWVHSEEDEALCFADRHITKGARC